MTRKKPKQKKTQPRKAKPKSDPARHLSALIDEFRWFDKATEKVRRKP